MCVFTSVCMSMRRKRTRVREWHYFFAENMLTFRIVSFFTHCLPNAGMLSGPMRITSFAKALRIPGRAYDSHTEPNLTRHPYMKIARARDTLQSARELPPM